jgi:hypothetical protein
MKFLDEEKYERHNDKYYKSKQKGTSIRFNITGGGGNFRGLRDPGGNNRPSRAERAEKGSGDDYPNT